jgi:hypothetical protein
MNKVTIIIEDMEDGSIDINFDTLNKNITPAFTLASDLFKLMQDYNATFEPTNEELNTIEIEELNTIEIEES